MSAAASASSISGPALFCAGPAAGLGWIDWGCYPLLPWSNRIPGGHLRFEGLDAQLPVNHTSGTAIHGLAASRPWTLVHTTDAAAELECG